MKKPNKTFSTPAGLPRSHRDRRTRDRGAVADPRVEAWSTGPRSTGTSSRLQTRASGRHHPPGVWQGVIETFRAHLPVSTRTPVITLLEGNTPLVYARHLSSKLGLHLYLKCEGLNPTASFKDRGMTLAVSKAVEAGAGAIMCASTGNTSASAAAYSAAAGLPCYVVVPRRDIAMGKLAQALAYGARVVAIDGSFDQAMTAVKEVTRRFPKIALVNSINPFRLEGQKTAAFEVCEALGRAPDYHALPVGNAGNITAYWMGYQEYLRLGKIRRAPIMLGFQARGADPIVRGRPIAKPRTVASAIRIGNPVSWQSALAAKDESGGLIQSVTDHEILKAYHALSSDEGVFVEPASAAGVAGIWRLAKQKYFKRDVTVVCTLTGHGLKDPERALQGVAKPIHVKPTIEAIIKALHL